MRVREVQDQVSLIATWQQIRVSAQISPGFVDLRPRSRLIYFLRSPITDFPGFDLSMKFQFGSEDDGLLKPVRFARRRDGIFATGQNLVAVLLPYASSLVARIPVSVTTSTINGRSTLYTKWPSWL